MSTYRARQTWLIHSSERTFECTLSNLNFDINSIWKCALIFKVASTFGGIVAHVSSVSGTSKSGSVIEKIVEDNEKSKNREYFCGQSLAVNIRSA